MNNYRYFVTVTAASQEQADVVMRERVYYDEEYEDAGYYEIDFEFHSED